MRVCFEHTCAKPNAPGYQLTGRRSLRRCVLAQYFLRTRVMEQHAHPPDLSDLSCNPYLDVLQWHESELETEPGAGIYSLSMISTTPPDYSHGYLPVDHEVTT